MPSLPGRGLCLALAWMAAHPSTALASTTPPDLIGRWTSSGGRTVEFGSCPEQVAEVLICAGMAGLEISHGLRERAPGVWTGATIRDPDHGPAPFHVIRVQGPDRLELEGWTEAGSVRRQIWRRARP